MRRQPRLAPHVLQLRTSPLELCQRTAMQQGADRLAARLPGFEFGVAAVQPPVVRRTGGFLKIYFGHLLPGAQRGRACCAKEPHFPREAVACGARTHWPTCGHCLARRASASTPTVLTLSPNYYGTRGEGHDLVFHTELQDALFTSGLPFVLSINDVPEARELYSRADSITSPSCS